MFSEIRLESVENFGKVNVLTTLKLEAKENWCGPGKKFLNESRFSEAAYRLLLNRLSDEKRIEK